MPSRGRQRVPESTIAEASRFVAREGWLLDQQRWDDWLDLYAQKCEFWLPCYLENGTVGTDPRKQISLIYYDSRAGLEDRVFRIKTGQSLASTPLPRTSHLINVGEVNIRENGDIEVLSSWVAHSYRLEEQYQFFGSQTHILRRADSGLKIITRHVIVMNDKIPCPLDIYSV